jgi:hypothetical protein
MARQGQTRQDLSPADLRALQREHDAYQLRLTGANYHVIGQALGITGEGARQCVKRAAAKVRAELEESPAD